MATAVYSSQVATMTINAASTTQQQPVNEDQQYYVFFCRALYDYQTDNDSSLSFRKGDIIEVLTQLESGWWDGLLGQERGWFPSNYVTVISDQEADSTFSAADAIAAANSTSYLSYQPSGVDVPQTVVPGRSSQSHGWGQQLHVDENVAGFHQTIQSDKVTGTFSQSSDFWVPRVSSDGRIYYLNTQTGQHSRDLPLDVDQDISDSELAGGFVNPRDTLPRTRDSVDVLGVNGQTGGNQAGFGIPPRSGTTPEPWKRVLTDDGMTYYFTNTVDGTVSWTLPSTDSISSNADTNVPFTQLEHSLLSLAANAGERETTGLNPSTSSSRRLRSDSGLSQPTDRSRSIDRYSIHSDDSDVQPQQRGRSDSSTSLKRSATGSTMPSPLKMRPRQSQKIPELTSAEQSAQSLQRELAPSPPDSVPDLAALARDSIGFVMQYIQCHDDMSHTRYGQELNERVLAVVHSVRNLLYVSATPSGHIPGNLYSRDARNPRPTPASQTLQTHLKPAQRKVAGTLSKLVLSTLAIQFDSPDKPLRMEADAAELDRAILAFVVEVRKFLNQNSHWSDKNVIKRLRGAFSVQNLGTGLPGAGAAACWKGFGWLALDEMVDAPNQLLSIEAVSELKSLLTNVEIKRVQLTELFADVLQPSDILLYECHELVRKFHNLILFISNIHVARHVDIDGIQIDNQHAPNRVLYLQTVDKARHLVRALELAVQALYDDSGGLFLAAQSIRPDTPRSPSSMNSVLSLSVSLKENSEVVCQIFEALLSVGHDQAELGQGDYNGSIEWRMSRISIIDSRLELLSQNQDDVVDMELAFRRQLVKAKTSVDPSDSSLQDKSQSSDAALEPASDSHREVAEDSSLPPARSLDKMTVDIPSKSENRYSMDHDSDIAALSDEEDSAATTSKSPPRGSKWRHILGIEAEELPQGYNNNNVESKKWYLQSDSSPSELLTDLEGIVRGGTIQALVERLTAHDTLDKKFNTTFLMTYKSFTSTNDLFDFLVQRYWIQPPDNLSPTELEEWKTLKQQVVRVRVLNIFKTMIEDDILESDDMFILEHLKKFLARDEVSETTAAKQLLGHIKSMQRGNEIRVATNTSPSAPPASIIPRGSRAKLRLTDIDPLEMARQLTLLESQLYQKIRPIECLQRSRDQKGDASDNISSVIQFANRIANWVADSVLSKEDSRRRAHVVKHFIHIADRCRTLHNFSSMVAIVSGLNTPPIRRLKRTWEQVQARSLTLLSACETTIDSTKNFGNYRSILSRIIEPCVPFIGVFLTQLTFTNENPNTVGPNLINFRKRQKMAEVIQDIKRWQSIPYSFHTVPVITKFIEDSLSLFNDQDLGDHFWNLSLEREPREREDEKMARLLQESGFL